LSSSFSDIMVIADSSISFDSQFLQCSTKQDDVPTETDILRPRQKSMGVPKVSHKPFLSLFQLRVDDRLPRRFTGPAGPDIKKILWHFM
jgi:hypothetical protein